MLPRWRLDHARILPECAFALKGGDTSRKNPEGATIRQFGHPETRSNKTVLLSYFSYDRKPLTAQDGNGKKFRTRRKLIS
jgi:hypothetical protein